MALEQPSTAPKEADPERRRRLLLVRRLLLAVLAVFVLLGLSTLLGVRSATVSAHGEGYELQVRYAAVTRPGLATPWSARVHRSGGFEGPVTIGLTQVYLDMFDVNFVTPEPSAMTVSGDLLVWEFDPPQGDTLTIFLDARLEPGVQTGRGATTAVLVDGRSVAAVRYTTRVMP